jgi:O-succinylbenzoic acid--CoA ligase
MEALAAALDGGPPLAPLPPDSARTLAMLQPELPVTEPGAALIVATSGSTGTPKGVVLSRHAVMAGAAATHARLGGPGHWTLAVPAHYVAGVMVVARAVLAGSTLHHTRPDLSDLPSLSGRNYLSLVPTQLIRALTDPRITEHLAGYDAILLGGAAADPALLDRCDRAGVTVVTTYGMSETSGGCVYDGVPLEGVDINLTDARVDITGDIVFSGYRLRPDLTAEVLDHRTLRTRDRAAWVDGRLRILGRVDDVVMSGGVNVDLAAVERALQRIDPHAAAIAVPDPEWGSRIVAALTTTVSLTDLRAALTALEPPARPRGLLRHPHLPHTSSGKIDRQTLIGWWRTGPAQRETL